MSARESSAKSGFDKSIVQSHLAAAWSRTIAAQEGKKGAFADALGCHVDTVNHALSGKSLPELHTVLNSLVACPNALDEVLALYGFRLVPVDQALSPDMVTLIEMTAALHRFCAALDDGRRDHRETIEIAQALRPLLPKLSQIIDEADKLKLRSVG